MFGLLQMCEHTSSRGDHLASSPIVLSQRESPSRLFLPPYPSTLALALSISSFTQSDWQLKIKDSAHAY